MVSPNTRYQCWWESELLGQRCDAYPSPDQAMGRLEEVKQREYFIRGVVIDMQEHLTSQEAYQTQQAFERDHQQFTEEYINNV
ncbi:hypothetical protein [Natronosalvus rutilus]|uniref:Uncharacterized protein n=1 Tax=Natronosalvus rutilus TaxID=2953753 RepID=A0A9E7NFQ7_9EURY|nr:hypothetical protein [Natronosalvus rutilus]UTF55983.1 hypothetical protein NGM29_21050 [Natronosalvus rutilus]